MNRLWGGFRPIAVVHTDDVNDRFAAFAVVRPGALSSRYLPPSGHTATSDNALQMSGLKGTADRSALFALRARRPRKRSPKVLN